MAKIIIVAALGLALTGCATPGGGGVTPTQISDTARQIQQYTRTFCSFVPTIQTIVSIVNRGAGDALSVATDICAAVTTAPLAEGGTRRIAVRGVPIRGTFVR